MHLFSKTCSHTYPKSNQDAKIIYLLFNPNKAAPSADSYSQTAERQTGILWEKTSQEFDIRLSHYHFLYSLSTLPFTDRALMLSLPPTCIWIACHRRKSQSGGRKKMLSISHPLFPELLLLPPSIKLEQVIITLTAFSVFTLSPNLSSRAACCANQLHGARRHFNLLSSARLHTRADWRMQAGCCSTSLCQDSYLSQSCQRCDWQPVTGSAHPPRRRPHPPLSSSSSVPRAEPTTRLREADITSVLQGHAQGISAADDTVTTSDSGCALSVRTHLKYLQSCFDAMVQCS